MDIIRIKLEEDDMLAELSVLEVDAIMELLELCFKTTYLQEDDRFYQQKESKDMVNSLYPVVSNIF
jgi:hypothetical protein